MTFLFICIISKAKGQPMVYFIALLVLFLDQLTKLLAVSMLPVHYFVPVFPFFNLFLTYNKGVSFSLFASDASHTPILLSIFSIIICIGVCYWMYKEKNKTVQIGLSLILGGAIGNIIDRIRLGSVIDFLDFHYVTYHWPAFNIADTAICIGAFLIFINLMFKKEEEKK